MLTVGDRLPEFSLQAVVSLAAGKQFREITNKTYDKRWQVLFFWPMDFRRMNKEFEKREAQVLGASIDTQYVHLAWREQHPDLKSLPFPMLADTKRELSSALGVLDKKEGVALRATFIVDPEGVIRWASVNDLSIGRNVPEVLRVLDALQTGELTPCNWEKGDETLHV